jgi:hypothetical protein
VPRGTPGLSMEEPLDVGFFQTRARTAGACWMTAWFRGMPSGGDPGPPTSPWPGHSAWWRMAR